MCAKLDFVSFFFRIDRDEVQIPISENGETGSRLQMNDKI